METNSPQPTRPALHGATLDADHSSLPISRLSCAPATARAALKVQRITTCSQLLDAAAAHMARQALAQLAKIDPGTLTRIVQRADMARVNGVGVVFSVMLAEVGIADVADLAGADPVELHVQLREHNAREHLARRSPTPEEVADWVAQARRLPVLVSYEPEGMSTLA